MPGSPHFPYCLSVDTITLDVRLGCEPEERAAPQRVHVDVRAYFSALPEECKTDSGDFICYEKIGRRAAATVQNREFRLIEYLAQELFADLRKTVREDAKLWVKATKIHVPVDCVKGSAAFVCTDLPAGTWVVPLD